MFPIPLKAAGALCACLAISYYCLTGHNDLPIDFPGPRNSCLIVVPIIVSPAIGPSQLLAHLDGFTDFELGDYDFPEYDYSIVSNYSVGDVYKFTIGVQLNPIL